MTVISQLEVGGAGVERIGRARVRRMSHRRDMANGATALQAFLPVAAPRAIGSAGGLALYVVRDLRCAEPVWRAFEKSAAHTTFQRFDWMRSWSREARDGTAPLLVFGFRDNQLKLIMPLAIRRIGPVKCLCWLAQDANDYNAPLVEPRFLARLTRADAQAICDAVVADVRGLDCVYLTRQPTVLGGRDNPFVDVAGRADSCAAHQALLVRDWGTVYSRLRSSKSRRRLREKANRLRRKGGLRFREVRRAHEAKAAIELSLAWKGRQLAQMRARNPFVDGRMAAHLRGLFENQTARLLRVYALESGGRPVAILVALVHDGCFTLFITAMDADRHENCSPGTLLLLKTMELAARSGLHVYDFSAGDETYKDQWCTHSQRLNLTIEGVSLLGLAAAGAFSAVAHAKQWAKSDPRVYRLAYAAGEALAALGRAVWRPRAAAG